MILDKVLILKGLGGLTALGGGVSFCIVGHKNNWWRDRQLTPEEIKTGLGLPADNCNIPTDSNPTTCSNIDVAKLKAINFEGKGTTDPTITDSGSVTLTITKTNDTTTFPQGYKFSFNPTGEVTISSTPALKIAKSSNTEFKIKGTSASNLSLEKAWTVTTLGAKVGLVCPDPSGEKKCSFNDGKINVNNGNNGNSGSKIEGAKFQTSTDISSKKMTYEEDKEGYNQGFKFYLEGSDDITLTNDASGDDSSGEKKIIKKGSNGSETTYEIKEDSDGKWYLTKYTATN